MGLFSKKKELPKSFEVLELNAQALNHKMQRIAERMFHFKNDPCMDDIRELIRIGKNYALLSAGSAQNETDRIKHQAKFAAFDDIQAFVEKWVTTPPKKEEDTKPRGSLNAFRRVSNQAGGAI